MHLKIDNLLQHSQEPVSLLFHLSHFSYHLEDTCAEPIDFCTQLPSCIVDAVHPMTRQTYFLLGCSVEML